MSRRTPPPRPAPLARACPAAALAGGAKLLVLDGFVLDVDLFAAQHPGGAGLVKTELGNDITVGARAAALLPLSSPSLARRTPPPLVLCSRPSSRASRTATATRRATWRKRSAWRAWLATGSSSACAGEAGAWRRARPSSVIGPMSGQSSPARKWLLDVRVVVARLRCCCESRP